MHQLTDYFQRIQANQAKSSSVSSWIWFVIPIFATLLCSISWVDTIFFQRAPIAKGKNASYTVRATHNAVFDLYHTHIEEAKAAISSYIPVYNVDNDIFFERQEPILSKAAQYPLIFWRFSDLKKEPTEPEQKSYFKSKQYFWSPTNSTQKLQPPPVGHTPSDAGFANAKQDIEQKEIEEERQQEIEALIRGSFSILETYFRDGVIGENEFPTEKKNIRVFTNDTYVLKATAKTHRFSSLYEILKRRLSQLFFKSEAQVINKVIHFVLERMSPNYSYAKENDQFISHISEVTGVEAVLIRTGEIIAERSQIIDNNAYYALKANNAARSKVISLRMHVGRWLLTVAILFLFTYLFLKITVLNRFRIRILFLVLVWFVIIVWSSYFLLLLFPLHIVVFPFAAVAMMLAVTFNKNAALCAAGCAPFLLLINQQYELTSFLVLLSGGIVSALVVHFRRPTTIFGASVFVGIVQALVFDFCRQLDGRPTAYAEMLSAGQAFLGGLLSSGVAVLLIPFAHRFTGRSSRGKLKVLSDFNHPLARELRERAPGTFAKTVEVMNMVDAVVDAIKADRLLARAGTLYHDIGKIVQPEHFEENQQGLLMPASINAPDAGFTDPSTHVFHGLQIAKRYRLPADVTSHIAEHHGTCIIKPDEPVNEGGKSETQAAKHYPGPKPTSKETAILMLAVAIQQKLAQYESKEDLKQNINLIVEESILEKMSEFQFEQSGLNQADLKEIRSAFVTYMESSLSRQELSII